jgi:aminopeptidase YwaD
MVGTDPLEGREDLRGRAGGSGPTARRWRAARRALPGLVLALALALVVAVPAAAVEVPVLPRAADAVSQELAYDHVAALSDRIGPRPGHTQAYFAAVAYAYGHLERLGYAVGVEDFTYRHWEDRGSFVELDGQRLEARGMRWSGSADVTAPLVDVGLARPQDLGAQRLDGRVALAKRGEITFQAKAENVRAAGALGVVVYNNEGGELNGQLAGELEYPVVGITAADGDRLLRAALDRPVRVVAASSTGDRLSSNVIAHGGRTGAGRVMVGAHLDSVPRAPGANDNASGSAAVLELARVFAGRPEQPWLSFALFGAEEDGLIGSRRHVAALGGERVREYRAMVNLDMVAVGDRFEVGNTGERSRDLARRLTDAGSALGLRLGQFDARGSSDHAPFADAGVPAVMLHWRDDPNYHQPTDTAGRIDREKLTVTTRVAARAIEEMLAGG